jgi:ADP-L-glycero-D-manno-heptose 6-epimerase
MYIVTGGAGFIGSAFVWKLNEMGIEDVIIVDNLSTSDKWKNLVNLRYDDYIHKDQFLQLLLEEDEHFTPSAVVHMGACSSTTEADADFLMENNYRYSQVLARFCAARGIRFINASSAATYGDGSQGFSDDHDKAMELKPLNMYGYSKQLLDMWAMRKGLMDKMVSLKFFNVFGPNEYHKGDMKSVVCKAFHQIRETGRLKLFKSYRPEYGHGEQMRDFVYVKDCVDVMWWLLENPDVNGIYNLGTGRARTWKDLGRAVFKAMGREPDLEFIEMPGTIRDKYQYFTQAEMDKLAEAGWNRGFTGLENAVEDYVVNYLSRDDPYLDPSIRV